MTLDLCFQVLIKGEIYYPSSHLNKRSCQAVSSMKQEANCRLKLCPSNAHLHSYYQSIINQNVSFACPVTGNNQ